MCGCLSHASCKAFLQPPRGPPLGLKEGETWIGRGSFEASPRAQLLCSRRQARFEFSETGLRLECHGCNPLYFVVCHSRNFFATQATPATELYQLRKGQHVQLTDGDQFYFVAMECLLTVVVTRQYDAGPIPRESPRMPPLQCAPRLNEPAAVKPMPVLVQQQLCDVPQEIQASDKECSATDVHNSLLRDEPLACPSPLQEVAAVEAKLPLTCVPQLQEEEPSASPQVFDKQAAEELEEATIKDDREGGDCRALDTSVCEPLPEVVTIVSPCEREEAARPASSPQACKGMSEICQTKAEELVGDAAPNNNVLVEDEALEDVECAQASGGREESSPLCHSRVDVQLTNTVLLGTLQGGAWKYSPHEACGISDRIAQRAPEETDSVMVHERVDVGPPGAASHASEPECGPIPVSLADPRIDVSTLLDPGPADRGLRSRSESSECRNESTGGMEPEEHFDEAGRVNDGEKEHEISERGKDEAWPTEPVEGMERVIASLSGYEGLERSNLVKLINKTGAAFTGDLSKANTHLVCRIHSGKKFDRAMKLHTVVVNHQWFEDCLRAGKRVSEEPYQLQSGEDVGPLRWKEPPTPLTTERAETSNKAGKRRSTDQPAFHPDSINEEVQNIINDFLPQLQRCPPSPNPRNIPQENYGRGNNGGQGPHSTRAEVGSREHLPGALEQTEVRGGSSRGRKSRKLTEDIDLDSRMKRRVTTEPESLVRRDATAFGSSSSRAAEQSHQSRVARSSSDAVEHHFQEAQLGHHSGRRKSRKLLRSLDMDGIEKELETAGSGHLHLNSHGVFRGGSDRAVAMSGGERQPIDDMVVINLSDDVENGMPEIRPESTRAENTKGKSYLIREDADGERIKGKSSQSSQCSQPDREIACAICLVEAKALIEGLLECGHKFCYKCIFTWTVQAVKGPSCPLCKAPCDFITRQELSPSGESLETVVVVGKKDSTTAASSARTLVLDAVCIQCGNSDSEALLMRCGTCGDRACHTFCMDPPAPPPWFCPRCTHGHQRESMRLAWNHFLPGPSTGGNPASNQETRPETRSISSARRRNQPYSLRRPSRPVSTYRPTLHREVMQSMGPVRRRAVVGQDSLHTWLHQTPDSGS